MSFVWKTPVCLAIELFAISDQAKTQRDKAIDDIYPQIQEEVILKIKEQAKLFPNSMDASVNIRKLFFEPKRFVIDEEKKTALGLELEKIIHRAELSSAEMDKIGAKLEKYFTSEGLRSKYISYGEISVDWEPDVEAADEKRKFIKDNLIFI
jgi:hypothetical protein